MNFHIDLPLSPLEQTPPGFRGTVICPDNRYKHLAFPLFEAVRFKARFPERNE
jgi:hypothetical protein